MRRSDVLAELRTFAFTVALLLVGELVVQVTGWHRLYVFAAALALGFSVRAGVQAARRRGRPRSGPAAL